MKVGFPLFVFVLAASCANAKLRIPKPNIPVPQIPFINEIANCAVSGFEDCDDITNVFLDAADLIQEVAGTAQARLTVRTKSLLTDLCRWIEIGAG